MSYNIDKFKVKRLENLSIPLIEFYGSHVHEDDRPNEPKLDINTNEVTIKGFGGSFLMLGTIVDKKILVSSIRLDGEGSGWFMNNVLERALKMSTGYLEVVMIWEGGDSITKMVVENGTITDTPYEL